MNISVLTIFPESFESFLQTPVVARAIDKGLVTIDLVDIKDFAHGSFRHIDDSPFGGGAGMVMRCQPVLDALKHVKEQAPSGDVRTVAMTPAGTPYDQKTARRFAELPHLVLLCGHYEGMDARIFGSIDEEVSMGDYILTGGELPAMTVIDSVVRLLPGALRGASTEEESFEDGLLEYPQYTQPRDYDGMSVPDVLLSGDHGRIRRYRRKEALRLTKERRPDLLERYIAEGKLTEEEAGLLKELEEEG
ncbi:MAG: tRNA (guanosine(37)-N1)-methyltransferase TrmD [Clostridia bacterium]|nr:tRNA (guanosine(37)-N1)-methyltransferase TrmD [Clostridia bacterium]